MSLCAWVGGCVVGVVAAGSERRGAGGGGGVEGASIIQ